jgi:hypothetical protein
MLPIQPISIRALASSPLGDVLMRLVATVMLLGLAMIIAR